LRGIKEILAHLVSHFAFIFLKLYNNRRYRKKKIQNGEDSNSILLCTTRLKDFEMRYKKQYKKYLDFDEMR
jgi:hypothetical protein